METFTKPELNPPFTFRFLGKLVLFFLLALGVSALVYVSLPQDSLEVEPHQDKGTSVNIKHVSLSKPGFVVVTLYFSFETDVKDFLGSSDYLPAGTYNNLHIEFRRPEMITANSILEVAIYHDNLKDTDLNFGVDEDYQVTNLITKKPLIKFIRIQ